MSKNILKSKTFWFNIVTILVVVATLFGYTPNQELASDLSGALVALSPIINIVLRYISKDAVTLLPK